MTANIVTQDMCAWAQDAIRPVMRRTPLLQSEWLSDLVQRPVYLKMENLQITGSFKVRGAYCRSLRLSPTEAAHGVITASAGNHGLGVAWAARRLGMAARVVVPEGAVKVKVEAIRALGATVIVHGATYNDADQWADTLAQRDAITYIHAFRDPYVIAGQSTIGADILEELAVIAPKASLTAIVPIGGGGLISGIGTVLAGQGTQTTHQLIGVQAERADRMVRSMAAGHAVPPTMPQLPTLADGLAGGVDPLTLALCQRYVHHTALVHETDIARAIANLAHHEHIVVEGSGAVGVAALQRALITPQTDIVVVVLSGGNIDSAPLRAALLDAAP